MLNLIEFFKKLFTSQKAASDLVDNLKNSSDLTNDQTHMLGNLLKLGNIQVRDIMVPRADIVAINIESDFEKTLKLFIEGSHSRLPVYRDQLDNIVGMLHVKDLLPYWQKNDEFSILKVKRNVLFSSPTMLVSDLLGQMRATRTHLAIIVDEQGGTDGIVTIEDLVEEIVGEIEDEHDDQDEPMVMHSGKGILLADARIELEEIGKLIGNLKTSETDTDIDTLGGLICSIIGRVPGRGECIRHESGIEFEIIDGDARRIRKVKIRGLDEIKSRRNNSSTSNHSGIPSPPWRCQSRAQRMG